MSGQPSVIDARVVSGTVQGLELEEPHRWLVPNVPTPNEPNTFSLNDQFVINEIMYHQRPELSTPTTSFCFCCSVWVSVFSTVDSAGVLPPSRPPGWRSRDPWRSR